MEMGSGGVAVVRLALRDCCFGSFQEVFGRAIQQFGQIVIVALSAGVDEFLCWFRLGHDNQGALVSKLE